MEYKKFGSTLLLRLDVGDEVLDCLTKVCEAEGVQLAVVHGIGAVNEAELGLYNPAAKKYSSNTFKKDMEIVALGGSVTRKDNAVYLHCHMAASDSTGATVGGHLNRAVVSATAEIVVDCKTGAVGRRFDEGIGLNLLDFT